MGNVVFIGVSAQYIWHLFLPSIKSNSVDENDSVLRMAVRNVLFCLRAFRCMFLVSFNQINCYQVFTANIKTKQKEGKWVMAGVALLMDVVQWSCTTCFKRQLMSSMSNLAQTRIIRGCALPRVVHYLFAFSFCWEVSSTVDKTTWPWLYVLCCKPQSIASLKLCIPTWSKWKNSASFGPWPRMPQCVHQALFPEKRVLCGSYIRFVGLLVLYSFCGSSCSFCDLDTTI